MTRRIAALLAVPLFVYLLLPTRNFYWDGVSFAINIEKRLPWTELVHPSHLVYTPFGSWIWRLLGTDTRALYAMQAANAVFGWAAVCLMYAAARRAGSAPAPSAAIALLFAASATWWRFATDADAYIPAVCLLLAAWLLLERGRAALAGVAHAGAMLFHELGIVFLPVAAARLWRRPRALAAYCATALIPVAAAYIGSYSRLGPDAPSFPAWITSHSPDSGFSFQPLRNLALTIRGTLRLFFGGKPGELLADAWSWVVLAAFLASVAALAWTWRRQGWAPRRPGLELAWAGAYVAFLFFWMPQNTFYRLFYLPPLLLLLARSNPPARTVALIALAVASWNFAFQIRPQARVDRNPGLDFALRQGARWPAGTAVLYRTFHPDLWTISYFNPQVSWVTFERTDLAAMEGYLAAARSAGRPLWMEATAYDAARADPRAREWLERHESRGEAIRYERLKREFRFYCFR